MTACGFIVMWDAVVEIIYVNPSNTRSLVTKDWIGPKNASFEYFVYSIDNQSIIKCH